MGRSQQRKGRNGEIELVRILNGFGVPADVGQALSYGTVPDIVNVTGIHVEVKRRERLNLSEAMKQAVRDAQRFRDGAPTVFHRRNREGWMVTMLLDDWIELYKKSEVII